MSTCRILPHVHAPKTLTRRSKSTAAGKLHTYHDILAFNRDPTLHRKYHHEQLSCFTNATLTRDIQAYRCTLSDGAKASPQSRYSTSVRPTPCRPTVGRSHRSQRTLHHMEPIQRTVIQLKLVIARMSDEAIPRVYYSLVHISRQTGGDGSTI